VLADPVLLAKVFNDNGAHSVSLCFDR